MVIITIPKLFSKVNDFQKSFNNLLMLNNMSNAKLGNVTSARNYRKLCGSEGIFKKIVKHFFFTLSNILMHFGNAQKSTAVRHYI